jgi:hypothetical protein
MAANTKSIWLAHGAHLGALQEGEAAGLARDEGDGSLDLRQRLPSEVLDQAPDHQ